MNENTLHLSISGLSQAEVTRLAEHVPVRHGVGINITDLSQVDDEPDTIEQHAEEALKHADEAVERAERAWRKADSAEDVAMGVVERMTALRAELHLADPQPHGTIDDGIFAKGGVIADPGKIASGTISASDLVRASVVSAMKHTTSILGDRTISAADTAAQHAPEQPPVYPEGRTLAHLATLARDLRKGGRVLVVGRTLQQAEDQCRTLMRTTTLAYETSSTAHAAGRTIHRLASGTTVRPVAAAAARGMSADLVIVAVPEDEYTSTIAGHIEPCVVATNGRVFSITEGGSDA